MTKKNESLQPRNLPKETVPATTSEALIPVEDEPQPEAPSGQDQDQAIRRIVAKGRLTEADARRALGLPETPHV